MRHLGNSPKTEAEVIETLNRKDKTIKAYADKVTQLEKEIAELKKPKKIPTPKEYVKQAAVLYKPRQLPLPIGFQKTFGWL